MGFSRSSLKNLSFFSAIHLGTISDGELGILQLFCHIQCWCHDIIFLGIYCL